MRVTLLSLVLLSCATTKPDDICVTTCGVQFVGSLISKEVPPGWTCDAVKLAEAKAIILYEKYNVSEKDSRFMNSCQKVKGYVLYVQENTHWIDGWGRDIMGATVCQSQAMQVGADPPDKGALMHEYAHAIQRCETPPPTDIGHDADHSNWSRTGIDDALKEWDNAAP